MYDLLLKGGTVVDAASGLDGVLDVAIENGKIARIAAGIVAGEAARVVEVGRQADVSVLGLRQGDWMVYDILGSGLRVDRAFLPHLTVKRGTVFAPDFGPRPWGWEPDRALPKGPIAGGCC